MIRGKRPFLFSLLLLLFFLVGCGLFNRDSEQPDTTAEGAPQLLIVCSNDCADRGQCGETDDRRQVVFGHPDFPATSGHQLIFEHETAVAFISTREETLQVLATGEQFNHTFYLVTRLEDGRSDWVADWCVEP